MASLQPLRSSLASRSLVSLPSPLRQLILRRTQSPSLFFPPISHHRTFNTSRPATQQPTLNPTQEPLIPAPTPSTGPLLTRQPNRALPSLSSTTSSRIWLRTLPIFLTLILLSSLGIFNYQKLNSSTVSSILYALRTNPTARQLLGDEIYFASKVPWIRGELNQLHGRVDVSFWVKGNKGTGRTRFVASRERRGGGFETKGWTLEMQGAEGEVVELLERDGRDVVMGREGDLMAVKG